MEMVKENLKIRRCDIMRFIQTFLDEEIWIGDLVIERYRDEMRIIVRLNDGNRWLEQRVDVSE